MRSTWTGLLMLQILAFCCPREVLAQKCRALSDKIIYRYDPSHTYYPDSAVVLSVSRSGSVLSILISVSKEQNKHLRTVFLKSSDGGIRWSTVAETASPLALASMSPAEAPSNNQIRYKLMGHGDAYLRSQDGGRTWITPKNYIEKSSTSIFAQSVAGSQNPQVAFSLAAINPKNPLELFATIRVFPGKNATNDAQPVDMGLYRSIDGAEHWNQVTDIIQYATPLGIDPVNPKIIYGQAKSGLVKSTDGGATWVPVGQQRELERLPEVKLENQATTADAPKPIILLQVRQIVVDPSSENAVYLITNKGIYRSNDGAQNWCLLDTGNDFIDSTYSMALDPAKTSSLFVGTRFGVLLSEDGGSHFRRIYPSSQLVLPKS